MTPQDFILIIAPYAVADMFKFSILASLTLSQAVLESGSGSYAAGNNLFGIKGPGQQLQTKEFIEGRWVTQIADFRSYSSWEESISDHSSLFHTARLSNGCLRYQRVLDAKNYVEACEAVYACGYATDPNYPKELINIIETYKLYQYDTALEAGIALTIINSWISTSWLNANDPQQKQYLHWLVDELRYASNLLSPYHCLDAQVADTIIDTWMHPSWKDAKEQKQKDYIHWLAVELRKASGQPVKNQ